MICQFVATHDYIIRFSIVSSTDSRLRDGFNHPLRLISKRLVMSP